MRSVLRNITLEAAVRAFCHSSIQLQFLKAESCDIDACKWHMKSVLWMAVGHNKRQDMLDRVTDMIGYWNAGACCQAESHHHPSSRSKVVTGAQVPCLRPQFQQAILIG
jgi:hypothetical protein